MNSDEQPQKLGGVKTPKHSELIACLGWNHSFGHYLAAYERAVEVLFKSIDEGHQAIDLIAPPLLFLMRHSMELGYKFSLWELHRMNGEPYDPKAYKNHRLDQLHEALQTQHEKAVKKYDLPDSHVDNFVEYSAKTEAGLKQFIALDAGSFNFRYPIDNTGKPNFDQNQTVDLVALKLLYGDAMILLRHTADVLGEYVDIHNYMMRDFHGSF
jgi:hypothetical protein